MLNQNRSVALRCLTRPARVSVDGGTGAAKACSSVRSSTFMTTVARRKSSIEVRVVHSSPSSTGRVRSLIPRVSPMRFVVYGAGAVGGVLAARLHLAGVDVQVVARGPHLDAIRDARPATGHAARRGRRPAPRRRVAGRPRRRPGHRRGRDREEPPDRGRDARRRAAHLAGGDARQRAERRGQRGDPAAHPQARAGHGRDDADQPPRAGRGDPGQQQRARVCSTSAASRAGPTSGPSAWPRRCGPAGSSRSCGPTSWRGSTASCC